jgi:hypothetical protein
MEKQIQLYEHLEWIEKDEICLGLFCFLKSILEPEDTSSAWKLWAMTLQLYALLPTTFDDHRHQKKNDVHYFWNSDPIYTIFHLKII